MFRFKMATKKRIVVSLKMKTTNPKQFFNKMWLKVEEHEYIYIFKIKLKRKNKFCDIAQ